MAIQAKGKVAKVITVDSVVITSFEVRTFPIGSERLTIGYAGGFYDVDSKFITIDRYTMFVEGAELNSIMSAVVDTSGGLYAALEILLVKQITLDSAVVA